jgi:hypothetical protein
VDLLEDLVDVGRVGLLAGLALALLVVAAGGGLLDGLLGGGLAGRSLRGGSLAGGRRGLLLRAVRRGQLPHEQRGSASGREHTSAVVDLGAIVRVVTNACLLCREVERTCV